MEGKNEKIIESEVLEAEKIVGAKEVSTIKETSLDNPSSGIDEMIKLAITSKTTTENLQKLMEMKYEYEARESKKIFHKKFSDMQCEMPRIKKSNQVVSKGKVMYKYASLDDILYQIKPILHEHGFTYRWTEGVTEMKNYKRITCHINGHGHEETAFVDIPIMNSSTLTNAIQQAGSSSTYGKRYSLCGVLGIITDDDDDGRGAVSSEDKQYTPNMVANEITFDINAMHKKIDEIYKKAVEMDINTSAMDAFVDNKKSYSKEALAASYRKIKKIVEESSQKNK